MAVLLREMGDFYHWAFIETEDPRTSSLPLMSGPFPILVLLVVYNMFVQCWGPQLMSRRKPFDLYWVMNFYNLFQVLANFYMFTECLRLGWGGQFNWLCQPVNMESTEVPLKVYLYFCLKITDLLDTVFFVLRKKYSQISFLHIYHHTGMAAISWCCVKWYPGGHDTFIGFINSFVHVIMYSYYLVTNWNPAFKKNMWWKKHITQLQMVQFFIFILHSVALLATPDCGYPKLTAAIFIPQNTFMLILFYDFYKKAYSNKEVKK